MDPDFLLTRALYMPDGKTVVKSNMTVGQAIEAIAFAYINVKLPNMADKCRTAKIKFENGKFYVSFADSVDHLSF